jgi:hypothetical protein
MGNRGLIGWTGFVGSKIHDGIAFNKLYNRNTVKSVHNEKFELLVCAAPTGNRRWVDENNIQELEQILFLIDHLRKASIEKFILISTIDVLAKPNTRYGLNRKILEGWVKSNIKNYTIIRLPTLIHPKIIKNQLFDLKNKCFLDKLNPDTCCQYYDLTNIVNDVNYAIENDVTEMNLFSEPISNREIVSRFFPDLIIGQNASPAQVYDIKPYKYDKDTILEAMRNYFQ